jgi:hypothetical protein
MIWGSRVEETSGGGCGEPGGGRTTEVRCVCVCACALVLLGAREPLLTKGAGLERKVRPGCRRASMATVIRLRRSPRSPGRKIGETGRRRLWEEPSRAPRDEEGNNVPEH